MLNNKKAQVGETVTWIVATLIIIFILIFFIFGSSILAKTKDIGTYRESLISPSSYQGDDLFLKKNLFTYFSVQRDHFRKVINNDLVRMEEEGNFIFSVNETKREMIQRLR